MDEPTQRTDDDTTFDLQAFCDDFIGSLFVADEVARGA